VTTVTLTLTQNNFTSGTSTGTSTSTSSTALDQSAAYSYVVPIDPMDELQCESCQ
jgi:hypothetical protein